MFRKPRLTTTLFLLLMFVWLSASFPLVQGQDTPAPQNNALTNEAQSLLAKAQTNGRVDVIIGLNVQFQPEGQLSMAQASIQQAVILQAQQQLLTRLSAYDTHLYAQYRTIPFVALNVDTDGLLALMSDPTVASIEEDIIFKLDVIPNLDVIDADAAWSTGTGYTGTGQTVAVIDSGVQENHPEFGNRVIPAAEACFSSQAGDGSYQSTCPGGGTSVTGPGAGVNCNINGCFHGTHVAGTIAGATTGVAPGANIIAINASTKYTTANVCGLSAPCIVMFSHNVISALEHVYSLRNSYSIAAVNLSLGGSADFRKYCDSPAAATTNGSTSYKAIFDNLVSANIAPVVASGNAGYNDAVELPACISSAVTVGASGNYESGSSIANQVASFSNSAYMVDLLAPGVSIYSALPGSSYGNSDGTSMAAPHVSGAWAILKQREPTASVTRILTALQTNGVSITDSKNGITRPRIDIDNALNSLIGNTVPTRPKIVINEVDIGATSSIELYNKESSTVTLTGFKLETYSAANALEVNYTFPTFTLPANSYVRLIEGSGTNTANTLYLNSAIGTWNSGAVVLKNSLSLDFVRWGSSTVAPPLGSAWVGITPAAPTAGSTLGRTSISLDRDEGADWFTETPSLGAQNVSPAPTNDGSGSPTIIGSLPYSVTQNTTLATNTGDPNLNLVPEECRSNDNSVWFRYTATANQVVQFSSVGSDYDTLITVWTGIGSSPAVVGCDDDNGQLAHSSSLSLPLTNGTVYFIQVTGGFINESGFLKLQVQVLNVPANDTTAGAIDITSIPSTFSQSTLLATNDTAFAPFPCASSDKAVWYHYKTTSDLTPVRLSTSGSNFDTLIIVWLKQGSNYTQVACNDDYDDTVDFTSQVDWIPTLGADYYIMISGGLFGDSGDLVLNTSFAPPPPANDEYTNAINIAALPYSNTQNTETATLNATDPDPSCDIGFGYGLNTSVWYKYVATSTKTLRISTDGSDYYNLISVFTRTPGWSEKACQDSNATPTTQVDFTATSGNTYYILIGGTLTAVGGSLSISVTEVTGPPLAPTLLSPANNTQNTDTTPTFTWQSVAGAVTYDIQLGTTNPPTTTTSGLTQTNHTPAPLTIGSVYYWRVRAVGAGGVTGDWSSIWSYTVTGADPSTPVLVSPAHNTVSTVTTPTFTWQAVTGAVSYELAYGINNPPLTTISGLTGVTYSPPAPLVPGAAYYWRVRTIKTGNVPSAWSPIRLYTVQSSGNAAPVQNLFTTKRPTLMWGRVTSAASYELQIDTDANFANPQIYTKTGILTTQWLVDQDLTQGVYYWRVRTVNAQGAPSPWSSAATFAILLP